MTEPSTTGANAQGAASYHLLREPWIPVRLRRGQIRWIAPHQLTEVPDPENPPVDLDSGRADFDGALWQFCIGLLQTAVAPDTEKAWRVMLVKPPTPAELQKMLAVHEDAFWLDGPGPRYMQELRFPLVDAADEDATGKKAPKKPKPPKALESVPIAWLMMDAPTDNAIELNKDLFVKRDRVNTLGYPAIAMALTTLQMNASGGGPGYRTSLRGGGPLSTLVDHEGGTLWERLWMNVLPRQVFETKGGDPALTKPEHLFPWMGPTRLSTDESGVTTTGEVHPVHQFWGMPWRLYVDFTGETGECDLLASPPGRVARRFYKRNYGFNYKGEWRHPLTPYEAGKKGSRARTVGEDGIPYRDWPALVLGDREKLPARVVTHFLLEQRGAVLGKSKDRLRLHAFGYEMDNAKARAWFDRTTPLFDVTARQAEALYPEVTRLVEAAQQVLSTLRQQIKRAIKRRPEDAKKDLNEMVPSFWALTETAFFQAVREIRDALIAESHHQEVRERWLRELHLAALAIFERVSQEFQFSQMNHAGRVAVAHNDLRKFTSPGGKKMRESVGLPPLEKENRDAGRKEPAARKKGKK